MTPPAGPVETLGQRLAAVHDELRDALRTLRSTDQPGRSGSLAAHCLAFCGALGQHHDGENDQLFPELAALDPGLGPALEQLRHDHNLIGFLLRDVTAATHALPAEPDAEQLARFRQRLDGLAAVLESHFTFEERKIRALLDDRPLPAEPPAWVVSAVGEDDGHG